MARLLYLDASAIVKLVVEEPESPASRDALRDRPRRVSSALAIVEVHLAAARRSPAPPPERVRTVLAGLTLIPVDQPALEGAAGLGAYGVRALDAIHLATARSLGAELESFAAAGRRLRLGGGPRGRRRASAGAELAPALLSGALVAAFGFQAGGFFPGSVAVVTVALAILLVLRTTLASDRSPV